MGLDVNLIINRHITYDEGKTLEKDSLNVFSGNITHNLNIMAKECKLYKALWRPEDLKVTKAKDLIPHLESGLSTLRSNPTKFKQYEPDNGWGTYDGLIDFTEDYLDACKTHPESIIEANR